MSPLAARLPLPFGPYLLLDRVDIGGVAEVWRGREVGPGGPGREVAIKRLLPHAAEEEELLALFHEEARICAQLDHPGIVRVLARGQVGGRPYLALEYVAGQTARAAFDRVGRRGERLPVPLACFVMAEVCAALHHAHHRRDAGGRPLELVHRDVSPHNVLLSYEGEVKLIDFGIARAAGRTVLTQGGLLRGKLGYLSPERVRQEPVDGRSDLFSAGVVLHELLTGERLFPADVGPEVLERVAAAEVPAPSARNPRVPPALDAIVLRALAREPAARHAHAGELEAQLRGLPGSLGAPEGREALRRFMGDVFGLEAAAEAARREEDAALLGALAPGGQEGA